MQTHREVVIAALAVLFLGNFLLLEANAQSSEEESLETVPCPRIIAFPQWGQYTQARKNKNVICLQSRKQIKNNFTRCRKDCGPDFAANTESFFSLSESGPSNSPAFQITKHSGVLYYEYSGEDSFKVDLVDFSTGKVTEKLIRVSKGPVTGSTYIHSRGTHYLRIEPASADADWSIDFEIEGQ